MKDFNLLKFRWNDWDFALFEVTKFFDSVEISICRYRQFEENYSGDWEVARWSVFQTCFYKPPVSLWAVVHLVGWRIPIKRKGQKWPDDLPF